MHCCVYEFREHFVREHVHDVEGAVLRSRRHERRDTVGLRQHLDVGIGLVPGSFHVQAKDTPEKKSDLQQSLGGEWDVVCSRSAAPAAKLIQGNALPSTWQIDNPNIV